MNSQPTMREVLIDIDNKPSTQSTSLIGTVKLLLTGKKSGNLIQCKHGDKVIWVKNDEVKIENA